MSSDMSSPPSAKRWIRGEAGPADHQVMHSDTQLGHRLTIDHTSVVLAAMVGNESSG